MTNKKLAQGAITTGVTTAYTVPTGYKTTIFDINISNTTTGALTATLYLVPSGGSAGTTNMLIPGVSLAANSLLQWTGEQNLDAGDTIQVIGSASGLTMNITGKEYR